MKVKKKMENAPAISRHVSANEVTARLARLSPHRVHEANWFKSILCSFGFHPWYYPKLDRTIPEGEIGYCRWCAKVKVHDVVH